MPPHPLRRASPSLARSSLCCSCVAPGVLGVPQAMGKNAQWGDEELTSFYQHYHNTTKDWGQVRQQ